MTGKVPAEHAVAVFNSFGLETKPPVKINGGRVLGLAVREINGELRWTRDGKVPDLPDQLTRRKLFSWVGQLTGHFPVCSWLRPACSFLKRMASGGEWDNAVGPRVVDLAEKLRKRVESEDPVTGRWDVPDCRQGRVWCDASSIATGISVEIGGEVVEDASWLRKEDDAAHINLAELEAANEAIKAAVAWGLNDFDLMTDSSTVFRWMTNAMRGDGPIRSHGMSELLVKRRISTIKKTIEEEQLQVKFKLIGSAENKADHLTRVPSDWLTVVKEPI